MATRSMDRLSWTGRALAALAYAYVPCPGAPVTKQADTELHRLTVITTSAQGAGSLADAIGKANAAGRAVVIELRIPTTDGGYDEARGVWTIRLAAPLPNLEGGRITIEGPSRQERGKSDGPAAPAVEITAAKPGVEYALGLVSPGNVVRCLGIGGFKYGVVLYGPGAKGCKVLACQLGLANHPNETGVIVVEGASGNELADNVISHNRNLGVYLGGRETKGNVLRNNRIGTDPAGGKAAPNRIGVMAAKSSENVVGPGNVISGNEDIGVLLVGKWTAGNVIRGNRIGVDAAGAEVLPNNIGVVIKSLANGNLIGGTASDERNVISGNTEIGIYVEASDRNRIVGNYIGPDETGRAGAGKGDKAQGNGVEFNTVAADNVLGGTKPGERNVISANRVYGVVYYGRCTRNTTVGNYIGVDATGETALPNATGICVDCASHHNDITSNAISGNMSYGMFFVTRGTDHNRLRGNLIGTNAAGTGAVPNDIGMVISTGACDNVVGGNGPLDRNVISGNRQTGVMITNQFTQRNVVAGNVIGLDTTGQRPLPNTHGVLLATYPKANVVRGNTISGNRSAGLVLWERAEDNEVVGNRIGADSTGKKPIGNGAGGVVIGSQARGNVIGRDGAENIIVGNRAGGVLVRADSGPDNLVSANDFRDNEGPGIVREPAEKRTGSTQRAVGAVRSSPAEGDANEPAPAAAREPLKPLTAEPSRAVFTVTTTRDDGEGSLRWAINQCNLRSGRAAIHFGIPQSDPGFDANASVWRITLRDTPPSLVVSDVTIDGATQPRDRTKGAEPSRGPAVIIDGADHSVEYALSLLDASKVVVRGLSVVRFVYGIQVYGAKSTGNRIEGCFLGLEPDGSPAGNYNGVELISGAHDNVIGGSQPQLRNVVSGNKHVGIRISDANCNVVIGNFVGLDPTGRKSIPNGDGICVEGRSAGNRIGGPNPGERNVVSGNTAYGIDLFGWGVRHNRILGNYVGTDHTGSRAAGNTYGVLFDDRANENVLGGLGEGEYNVISGNTAFGAYFYNNGTRRNVCQGNRIGTDATGMHQLGNEAGVHIDGATRENVVDRNLISGNRVSGVTIFAAHTDHNVITRNRIGVDITGKRPLGNGADGVRIAFGPRDNVIGGADAGNVIAHNGAAGVSVESSGSTGNRISRNAIYDNAGLAIDLGPNPGMKAPVIESVRRAGDGCVISGTVDTPRPETVTIEVYVGDARSGSVQAREYVGETSPNTAGRWMLTVPGLALPASVAASATDSAGNTSEFGLWATDGK